MNKKVTIIDPNGLNGFNSIDEYLKHTYGEKKLEQSKKHSEPTVLDVVGYTLDERGFETVDGKYYELVEIESLMINKSDDDEEDMDEYQ